MKFEYRTIIKDRAFGWEYREEDFNKLGAKGWEIIYITDRIALLKKRIGGVQISQQTKEVNKHGKRKS